MTEQELMALAQILSGEGWRTIAPDPIVTPPAAQKVIRQMSGDILRLAARLAEVEVASQWQPIETAPKDRTRIDIWAKTWLPTFDRFGYRRFADCTWMDGDSMCNRPAYWLHLDKEWCPTHWRHTPAPPTHPRFDHDKVPQCSVCGTTCDVCLGDCS